jgi:hypothetical protein
MTKREIQQAIDVCRPGDEDLQQPEMAALVEALQGDVAVRRQFERSQRFDAAMTGIFRDVPVPDGIEDRLLAALDLAVPPRDEVSTQLGPRDAGLDCQAKPGQRGRRAWSGRRRMWTVVAGGLGATAALLAFLLVVPFSGIGEPRADDRLPGEVLAWTDAVVQQGWNTDFQAQPLRDHPLDRAVRAIPQRWCVIRTAYDQQTVVYDLAPRGRGLALVFCLRSRVRTSALPESPPWNVFPATGGLTLGVWRRGELVYVLAVQGGAERYRALIESPPLIGLIPKGRSGSLIPTA